VIAPPAAPERRKGPLGQTQVRVRDEWLDEDAPGTMLAWAEWQAEGRHEAAPARQSAQTPRQQPKATREPTARQREVWASVVRHDGDQQAAADELGITQGGISSGIKGYMKNTGTTERPWHGKAKTAKKATPDKRPAAARPLPTRAETQAESVAPRSEQGKTEQGRRGGPGDLGRHTTDPAEPLADHAPVLHPPVDENVEPVDASEVADVFAPGQERLAVSGSEHRTEARETGNTPPEPSDYAWSFSARDPDTAAIVDAHRDGYARGYAVAVLRVLAAWDRDLLEVMPNALLDMACDAADGLMS